MNSKQRFEAYFILGQGGPHSGRRRWRPHQGAVRARRQLPQVRDHG